MLFYLGKVLLTALAIVAVSELARRSTALAALLAAVPLTSLLAFIWLRLEGAPPEQIATLSASIFWLVLPSLLLFLLLPPLLRHGLDFWLSLALALAATVAGYGALLLVLRRLGISL